MPLNKETKPNQFLLFILGEAIIPKCSWTFKYDGETVAATMIFIDLPFIVNVAWRNR